MKDTLADALPGHLREEALGVYRSAESRRAGQFTAAPQHASVAEKLEAQDHSKTRGRTNGMGRGATGIVGAGDIGASAGLLSAEGRTGPPVCGSGDDPGREGAAAC